MNGHSVRWRVVNDSGQAMTGWLYWSHAVLEYWRLEGAAGLQRTEIKGVDA